MWPDPSFQYKHGMKKENVMKIKIEGLEQAVYEALRAVRILENRRRQRDLKPNKGHAN